jgi:quinol monooxygenase YgiN
MSVIAKERNIVTLIITLTVKPQNCDALLDLITHETKSFMSRQPGFISANLHRNAERTRIVNYGQWESRALYDVARSRDEFKALSQKVEALADSIDPVAYEVVFTEEHPSASRAAEAARRVGGI